MRPGGFANNISIHLTATVIVDSDSDTDSGSGAAAMGSASAASSFMDLMTSPAAGGAVNPAMQVMQGAAASSSPMHFNFPPQPNQQQVSLYYTLMARINRGDVYSFWDSKRPPLLVLNPRLFFL